MLTPTESWHSVTGECKRGAVVEFRLVYDGRLPSASNSSRIKEKHDIRKSIHQQLVQLTEIRKSVEGLPCNNFQAFQFVGLRVFAS